MAPETRQTKGMTGVHRERLLNGMGRETRHVSIAVTVSLMFHLLFFSIFIFMQTHSVKRRPVESFISVNLVSMPEAALPSKPQTAPAAPVPKEPAPTKPEPAVSTKPTRQAVDVPAKPKEKVSLKKKTFKTETVKKSALEKIEKKVETDASEQIARAMDRLKSKVEKENAKGQSKTAIESAPKTGTLSGESQSASGRRAELIDVYRVEVAFQIQKNWAFPDQFAEGRSDLQTMLVFKIMPNGQIKDLFFTDRSGNKNFDESAYRAVLKSNPVDPHPKGVSEPFVPMGLRFTPEGIK